MTQMPKPGQNGGTTIVTTAGYEDVCSNAKTCNQPVWTRDANGNETDYQYDPTNGGVALVTQPPGVNGTRPQTRFGYSSHTGQDGGTIYLPAFSLACRTLGPGACDNIADQVVTGADYGSLSNNLLPLSTTRRAGDYSVVATSSMGYDAVGNMVTSTDPMGAVTQYRYNADRELVETISPDPDGGGPLKPRAVRTNYNADGTVGSTEVGTDDGSFVSLQQMTYAYDVYGRKVQEAMNAGGVAYSYRQMNYDALGRPNCVVVRMNPAAFGSESNACVLGPQGSDGPDRIVANNYDAVGRSTALTIGVGTNLQAYAWRRSYTPNGLVANETDANGNETGYARDGFDRVIRTHYPNPSGGGVNPGDYEGLTYDARGLVTSRRMRDGATIGYSYDALGRLTSKVRPNHNTFWETDLSYGWDNLGHLITANDGPGHYLAFAYDALGRMTSQGDAWYATGSASFQYDAAGRMTRQTWWDGFYVNYGYDALGEMTGITEGGGYVPVSFGYDDLGRRTVLNRANGAGTVYNYDAGSRLTSLTQAGNANVTFGYGYNAAGQIARRTQSNDAYAWGGAVTTDRGYGVDGLNRYTSSGSVALGYDGRGNLASSGSSAYGYTSENQLATGPNAQLGYDALGRLFNVTSDGGRNTTLSYAGDQVLAELDQGTGAVLRRYVYGPGSDEPLIWYEGAGTGDRRFLHADERGSVIAVTDGSGNVSAINTYDEFGIPGSNNQGRFQYTGQKWLPALGLYDYKARTYSPTLGRFLQTDPIGYADGMNWYNYAGGDPVNGSDSSGLYIDAVVTGSRYYSAPSSAAFGNVNYINQPLDEVQPSLENNQVPIMSDVVITATRIRRADPFANAALNFHNLSVEALIWVSAEMPQNDVVVTGARVHGIWTYGNFCGAGGAGTPINAIDAACMRHDKAFGDSGADWTNMQSETAWRKLNPTQRRAVQRANQALCNAMTSIAPTIPWWNVSQRTADAEINYYFHNSVPAGAQCR